MIDSGSNDVDEESEPFDDTMDVSATPTQYSPTTQSEGVMVPTTAGISSQVKLRMLPRLLCSLHVI